MSENLLNSNIDDFIEFFDDTSPSEISVVQQAGGHI